MMTMEGPVEDHQEHGTNDHHGDVQQGHFDRDPMPTPAGGTYDKVRAGVARDHDIYFPGGWTR